MVPAALLSLGSSVLGAGAQQAPTVSSATQTGWDETDHSGWFVNFGEGTISGQSGSGADSAAGGLGINLNTAVLIIGALVAVKIIWGRK